MRMIIAVGSEELLPKVQEILEEHQSEGYTEIRELVGAGATGKKMGTRAMPGTVGMILSVVPKERMEPIVEALRELCNTCYPSEGLRVFVLPAEQVL